jgi:large subunit ribosomal protein L13
MQGTTILSSKNIKATNLVIDAKGKVLGRLAVDIAKLLAGKDKVINANNLVAGDKVTVINAKDIMVTGNKKKTKIYHSHSGWPQGEREETLGSLLARKPTEVIKKAVKGMLPNNKLRDDRMRRLVILAGGKDGQ